MNLKRNEIIFLVICAAAAVAFLVYAHLVIQRSEDIVVTAGTSVEDSYDVSAINSASKEDFMEISGIGEVKAGDIIDYRSALGGFTRVSQLKDVSGISDEIYNRIIEYFCLGGRENGGEIALTEAVTEAAATEAKETSAVTSAEATQAVTTVSEETKARTEPPKEPEEMKPIDVNSASAEEISRSLLIDDKLAEEIVALREKIHGFSAVQELDLCESMTKSIYSRIKGYVIIGEKE